MNPLSAAVFIFSMLAWASYIPVSKSPRLRRTMWPTVVLIALAFLVEIAIVLVRPADANRVTPLDIVTFITLALFAPVYFLALRVPRSAQRPQPGQPFPPTTFALEDDKNVATAEYLQRGPLLLVFYRGFW